MEIKVNIKSVGLRHGTSGWLKNQIESEKIWFEESNDYYIPIWSPYWDPYRNIKTHGLVIRDGKNSALIAYRNTEGEYVYNVSASLGSGEFSHWPLNLTEAAEDSLREICKKWVEKMELEEQ